VRTAAAAVVLLLGLMLSASPLRGQSSALGEWSAVFDMPLVAVHAAWMSTGRILFFDAWEIPGTPSARLWDPGTNAYTPVPNGFAELFCAGHILAHDGRLFTTGGHNGAGVGTPDATTFDPTTGLWTALPSLNFARWYPSLVQLGDGRLITIGGAISRPLNANQPEVLAIGGEWAALPEAQAKDNGEYPLTLQAPNGKVFISGGDAQSWLLDVDAPNWIPLGQSPAAMGPGVMYRPGKVMMAGGGTAPNGADPVVTATGVIDLNAPAPTWRSTAPMAFGRSQHNFVILPDGRVLVVGGASEVSLISTNGVLPAEIWDPDSETWTTVAAMTRPRMYHSTALLVPDGRVLTAGGGRINPVVTDELNGQFYSPPYLFKGPRPTVTSAPSTVSYGGTFTLTTPDPAGVARVTFVRTSSVTHGVNFDQRYFELPFTTTGGGVVAQAPASPRLAPAGDYFVFTLNDGGVPSVGRLVRLTGAPVTPVLSISDATAAEGTPSAGALSFSVTLSNLTADTVTVDYATSSGTAVVADDFDGASGTLTFPPFTASRSIVVTTRPDTAVEDNETFTVTLSDAVKASLGDATATGTIVNDDEPIPPALTIAGAEVVEGSGGASPVARFTVTLSEQSAQNVLVDYRTLPGTAAPGADFTTTKGVLTFVGGSVAQTIQVPVQPDVDVELDETFTVELFNPVGATLATPLGTGTIRNDDNGIATATFIAAAGSDDANEDGSGLAVGGTEVWAGTGDTSAASYLGLRFPEVSVPAGAEILAASLELHTLTDQAAVFTAEAGAEASAASAPFGAAAPPSARPLLAPRVTLEASAAWTGGLRHTLGGLTPLVQAVVEQPGWVPGGPVTVILRGTGPAQARRLVASAESGSAIAPRLVVTYMVGTPTPNAPRALTAQVVDGYTANFGWLAPATAGRPVVGYVLDAGLAPGHTVVSLPLADVTSFSTMAPEGRYFVRVRARTVAGYGPPSNEVVIGTGQAAPPAAPAALLATVVGTQLTFRWEPPATGAVVAGYELHAGWSPGATTIGRIPLPASPRQFAIAAPPGTYYVRVVAVNAAGAGPPSPEVTVTPGAGACTAPGPPTGVQASVAAGAIAIRWDRPADGAVPTIYVLQAGSIAGAADRGTLTLSGDTYAIGAPVPAGAYFVRVAAANACGASAASAEVSAVVP